MEQNLIQDFSSLMSHFGGRAFSINAINPVVLMEDDAMPDARD